MKITAERLREVLDYDWDDGAFRWKIARRGVRAGAVAGSRHNAGYWRINLYKQNYLAHRLAWLWVHGEWPPDQIDHINGNRSDNRIVNLRCATHGQNLWNRGAQQNNTSGLKGVTRHSYGGWQVQISKKYIGCFKTPEEAHAAYCAAAKDLHGEFARTA